MVVSVKIKFCYFKHVLFVLTLFFCFEFGVLCGVVFFFISQEETQTFFPIDTLKVYIYF